MFNCDDIGLLRDLNDLRETERWEREKGSPDPTLSAIRRAMAAAIERDLVDRYSVTASSFSERLPQPGSGGLEDRSTAAEALRQTGDLSPTGPTEQSSSDLREVGAVASTGERTSGQTVGEVWDEFEALRRAS